MPIDGLRPFTEIFEASQLECVRDGAKDQEAKYKGFINQVYVNELRDLLPERYIRTDAFLTAAPEYTTGTVTVGSGTTNIVGLTTSWNSANSDDFQIKVSGADEIFRMTFTAGTDLAFKDTGVAWTGSSGSGLSYSLFQNRYALASDFDYLVEDDPDDPSVVYRWINGSRVYMTPWADEDEYNRNYTFQVSSMSHYVPQWKNETPYIYIWPNPEVADLIGYSYIPALVSLRELTTGTATISAASGTAVVLTSDANMTVSLDTSRTLYIRNDADGTGSESVWAKIASVANSSVATIDSTQSLSVTSGATLNYTISEVSKWPNRFDDVMMYKTAYLADPDNDESAKWLREFNTATGLERTTESHRKTAHRLKGFSGLRDG